MLTQHLRWGVALGIAAAASTQVLTWMDLGLTSWVLVARFALVIVFVALAARSLRRRLGSPLSLLRAAGLVLAMILVSNAIWQTYMFAYINFIDPSWVDRVAELWSAQLRDGGRSEGEIAETIQTFRDQWQTRHVFTVGIVQYALPPFVLGFVTAVAAAVRPRTK